MNRAVVFAILVAVLASPLAGAQVTNPIRYTWIAESCEKWNCAAAALVMANGEPNLIVLPTGHDDRPWLILRRVEEGSVFIPETEPFSCEVFETVDVAISRFTAMNNCHAPLILNVPDGKVIVTARAKCSDKRRAVR